MTRSASPASDTARKAHPLPAKIVGWEPLHLTFRHTKLPDLPIIHHPEIWAVLRITGSLDSDSGVDWGCGAVSRFDKGMSEGWLEEPEMQTAWSESRHSTL
jgi:hypothetical protein